MEEVSNVIVTYSSANLANTKLIAVLMVFPNYIAILVEKRR
jgi:hypothetical protein